MLKGFVLAAALLTTGCLSPSNPSETPPPATANPATELHLSQCNRWEAGLMVPAALNRGNVPAGWIESRPPLAILGLEGWVCERFSLGTFERGPIHFIIETHDPGTIPSTCMADRARARPWVLSSLWIDDPEVARYLALEHALPVHNVTIAVHETPMGPALLHTWAWGFPGSPASRVTVLEDELRDSSALPAERLFWPRGNGLASLDLVPAGWRPASTDRVVQGTAVEPMLLSVLPAFAASGFWSSGVSGDGKFNHYEDATCAHLA